AYLLCKLCGLGGVLGVDNELHQARVISQIGEHEAAVIAPPRRPTGERHGPTDVVDARLSAAQIAPSHGASLLDTSAWATLSSAAPTRRIVACSRPTTTTAAAPNLA